MRPTFSEVYGESGAGDTHGSRWEAWGRKPCRPGLLPLSFPFLHISFPSPFCAWLYKSCVGFVIERSRLRLSSTALAWAGLSCTCACVIEQYKLGVLRSSVGKVNRKSRR